MNLKSKAFEDVNFTPRVGAKRSGAAHPPHKPVIEL